MGHSLSEELQMRSGHESAKVGSVAKLVFTSRLNVARPERSETMSGGKQFQTAGAACEKAQSVMSPYIIGDWHFIDHATDNRITNQHHKTMQTGYEER